MYIGSEGRNKNYKNNINNNFFIKAQINVFITSA